MAGIQAQKETKVDEEYCWEMTRGKGGMGPVMLQLAECIVRDFGFQLYSLRNAYLTTARGNSDLQKIPYHNYCGHRRVSAPRNCVEPFIRADLSAVSCYDSLSFLHDEQRVASAADRGALPHRVHRASGQ